MAKNLKTIDITDAPELLRVAEEVQRTRQPHLLQRDNQDVAIVLPVTSASREQAREQMIEAQIWADVGLAGPEEIWAGYDASEVQRALQAAQGALSSVDQRQLIRDLDEQRGQDSNTRPV